MVLSVLVYTAAGAGQFARDDALFTAISTDNYAAARTALDAGADPNARYVTERERFDLVRTVRAWLGRPTYWCGTGGPYSGESPLHFAATYSDAGMIRLLVERGADPNRSAVSWPPLRAACWHSLHDGGANVEALLRGGAHVDAVEPDGETALMYATWTGNLDAVRILLRHGANPRLKDNSGKTALDHAVKSQQASAIRLLRDAVRVRKPPAP
jgi:ankyrin repeat protein